MAAVPPESEIGMILEQTPHTMFITISRYAAAALNQVAVSHLFQHAVPLLWVDADPEANPENFEAGGQLSGMIPLRMPVYHGMRVHLTRNMNKEIDFVNGMEATVLQAYRSGAIKVRTKTGYPVSVFPWTDPETRVSFLPMRAGYACTLAKMQGATLDHVTVYLDKAGIEAAAYVALSRVRKDADWQYVGDPQVGHFVPADYWHEL